MTSPNLVRQTPLFFGSATRRRFGWYHEPVDAAERSLAVVLCPPIGHEYIVSHRTVRTLADALAAVGVATLRFDYDGTGDACGADDDPNRLGAWVESVGDAVREVRSLASCSRVGVVGLRIGATLAALSAVNTAVDALVLWAPCARGRTYVRELRALRAALGGATDAHGQSDLENAGFVLTAETQAQLRDVDLAALRPKADRVLIIDRDDVPQDLALQDRWRAAGLAVEHQFLPGYAPMMTAAPHQSAVPDVALCSIVDWLTARVPVRPAPARDGRPGMDAVQRMTHRGPDRVASTTIQESVLQFGLHGGRFGILTEPTGITSDRPTIVMANAGSTHHIGPGRLYVDLARTLAHAGFRSLRMDLPGIGDSSADPGGNENDPYLSATSAVVSEALDALSRRRRARSFVLMGLCSGAHAAFHAGLDLDKAAIVECLLINPLTFYYKRGMSLDQPMASHHSRWQAYKRAIWTSRGWAKLFGNTSRIDEIKRIMAARLAWWLDSARTTPAEPRMQAADDLQADLSRLVTHGRRVTFLFARYDPGYDILMAHAGASVRRFGRTGALRIWQFDGANHTFDAPRPRAEMIARICEHLTGRYAAQPAAPIPALPQVMTAAR